MITVEYPPGAVESIHRHDAYAFVYVLEGSIVEQVRGGKEVTLMPGQTFYEGPNDVHTVGRNASTTKPAKFVVVRRRESLSSFSLLYQWLSSINLPARCFFLRSTAEAFRLNTQGRSRSGG